MMSRGHLSRLSQLGRNRNSVFSFFVRQPHASVSSTLLFHHIPTPCLSVAFLGELRTEGSVSNWAFLFPQFLVSRNRSPS